MTPIDITLVAGARPNFMKIAPLIRAFGKRAGKVRHRLVDTGQHSDPGMNRIFFEELGIPEPDTRLEAGGSTHAEVTARVMVAMERELTEHPAHGVLVVGDVNSTLAAAITDLFFVTEPSGHEALLREGHPADRIHFVGNVMIDNLFHQIQRLQANPASGGRGAALRAELGSTPYGVVTLHRPSNVDHPEKLAGMVGVLRTLAKDLPLVFPVHPRTRASLERHRIDLGPDIRTTPPLSYMEFLSLWKDAQIILTDSGGLQEESSAVGVRCVTLRDSTERPVTITDGTNVLAGTNPAHILEVARAALSQPASGKRPLLWDGRAAERILDVIVDSPLFAQ